ncbi:hypothetical protein FVEN_g2259 [Fusarium venenatum]|uniref:Uncharacterized protein n=1 Tax=Fusarium venenatum TaxID=56646 RepID=A0A2L2TI31_9HYPO|nr:uncharacterized protein FVRRES_12688 [Fusarium venenatum]KAG8360388.1 hypothetical protein FVEN_g2259 [Fusarium venenatum]KAH6979281.1 hypothetical protein EDB82DRAFT_577517 [Fusarium venenatum]CEI39997.1 unnamed protein product [Fusarium venenatum]
MTPQKVYSRSELENMRLELGPKEILKIFYSPGMAFEAFPTNSQRQDSISTTGFDERHDVEIHADMIRANIYNAFADQQATYGIPVRARFTLCPQAKQPIPRVLRDTLVDYFYLRKGAENPLIKQCPHDLNRYLTVMPFLGENSVMDAPVNRNVVISLPEMVEIGMDVESISATIGDALAMFVFKCGLYYFGYFCFRIVAENKGDSPGPVTVGIIVSDSPRDVKQRHADTTRATEDMVRMAEAVELQVPSPIESPYLWNIFKTAFIARGKRYCCAIRDTTPEGMMELFEEMYGRPESHDKL